MIIDTGIWLSNWDFWIGWDGTGAAYGLGPVSIGLLNISFKSFRKFIGFC